jgi:hypothetical protein
MVHIPGRTQWWGVKDGIYAVSTRLPVHRHDAWGRLRERQPLLL